MAAIQFVIPTHIISDYESKLFTAARLWAGNAFEEERNSVKKVLTQRAAAYKKAWYWNEIPRSKGAMRLLTKERSATQVRKPGKRYL
jgi:hypothetical protein